MTGGGRRNVIATLAAALAVVTVAVVVFVSCHSRSPGGSSSSVVASGGASASSSSSAGVAGSPSAAPQPPAGMAKVALASLPVEAQGVVDKLDHGGGFKYRQDGATFTNRERRLPAKPHGYYREYTVATPGAPDRGPRRLILGGQGELYYTSDHYRTFQWVVRGGTP